MRIISFMDPTQPEVIQKILTHCGLADEPPRAPPQMLQSEADPSDAMMQAAKRWRTSRAHLRRDRGRSSRNKGDSNKPWKMKRRSNT